MVNLHILTLEKSSKWAKNIQKEPKTSVFGSFLTESVISVNVDGFVVRNSYTITPAQHLCLLLFLTVLLNMIYFLISQPFFLSKCDLGKKQYLIEFYPDFV